MQLWKVLNFNIFSVVIEKLIQISGPLHDAMKLNFDLLINA